MCIDFLNENVKEAQICFGYNLETICPTALCKNDVYLLDLSNEVLYCSLKF